jgi:UDP-N-acetylmuramyl tripeptide synthase
MATHALRLALPGTFNRANAVAALAAVTSLGVPTGIAAARLAEVDQVAGRYAWATLAGREVRLLLVKNPAGWSEICGMMEGRRNPLVMVINAQEADGIDVSWLWDLRLDGLCGRSVAVAGERAADLGVRLSYAGVGHSTELDPLEAIRHMPPGLVEVVATYSAFSDLVRRLRPRPTRSVTEHDRPPEATEPTTTAL